MAYDGQVVSDLDETRPDGDSEAVHILDDSDQEIKRVLKNTTYSYSKFVNQTGISLVVGNVVALAFNGLVADDVAGSFLKHVVVIQAGNAGAICYVAHMGVVNALTAGTVTALNYVRKSAVAKAIEDMGIPAAPGTTIPTGAIGFALQTVATPSLCSIFLFDRTNTAPTTINDHVVTLVNRTGATLSIGETVVPDPANNGSVILDDVQGSLSPRLIAYETISNLVAGRFIQTGAFTVVVQGAVVRNHYLRKATVTKALEDTGIAINAVAAAPPGTVGISLTEFVGAGAGSVIALLFGQTTSIASMSIPSITHLNGVNNPATPFSKMDFVSLRTTLLNPINGSTITLTDATTLTCDLLVQGRNGRDQASVFVANSWLYFYYTWDGLTRATRVSLNAPTVGPVLANNETHYVYIAAVRLNNSNQLAQVFVKDTWTYYKGVLNMLVAGAAIAETAIATLNSFVPPSAPAYELNVYGLATITGNNVGGEHHFDLRIATGLRFKTSTLGITGVSDGNVKRDGLQMGGIFPNTGFLAYLWTTVTGIAAVYSATMDILGYQNQR